MIGGSLALALRKRRGDEVRVWTRSEATAARVAEVIPFVTCNVEEAVQGARLCVLCTPIGAMPPLAEKIATHLEPSAAITDAGSVKAGVVRELEGVFGGRYVGSHPMAGSERSGFAAAEEDLFEGAVCIVTPTPATDPETAQAVRAMWESLGSRILQMSPEEHDAAIGRVSHLPHAVAAALVNAIGRRVADAGALAGKGYRDTTRIAGGPPAMWAEILLENREALLEGLDDLIAELAALRAMLLVRDSTGLEQSLEHAKNLRSNIS